MKLVFALGNHESRYDHTRHNVGFQILESIAHQHAARWSEKTKLKAQIAEISVDGEKILLAKPTTYYNLAGESFHAICNFYTITPSNVLVVHDELALPLGTVRTRIGGSDGGNNGIKNILAHDGYDTNRLRIGITTPLREQVADDATFVLGKLSSTEQATLDQQMPIIMQNIAAFIDGTFEATTHQVRE